MSESSVDIRYFESLDTIVSDVGHKVDVVDIKLALQLSLGIYCAEEVDLVLVEILPHLLHHPYISEELGTQVAVAHHHFLYHTEMRVD